MRSSVFVSLITGAAWFQAALGLFPPAPKMEPLELADNEETSLTDAADVRTGTGTFTQYIDHKNPDVGTFSQSFWYNATNWKGPGSPVVIMTPGEVAAAGYTGYLTEKALTGMYAKAIEGAVIIVEHRYWGNSSPFDDQTTKNLQYLTLEQSVADFVNFARNVKLPFDPSGKSNAPQAPWVFTGGSYPGALAVWIEKLSPGTFWAYHGSSGPLQAIYDYWQYFQPIQDGMPKNCSSDYSAIIDYVDMVFTQGSSDDKAELKKMFGVDELEHDDDAASAISSPIWAWQSIQFDSGYSKFYQMCDAIEGAFTNTSYSHGEQGVGVKNALPNFAKWFKASYLPGYCEQYGYKDWKGKMNVQCFNSYDGSMEAFKDYSPANTVGRTWVWMTCNEPFFYYQTGAPTGVPTVFSRLVNAAYYQRQCELWFPREGAYTYGSARGDTAERLNLETGGWLYTNTTRLLTSNGQYDPWRPASVSSEFRPGGPFRGTPKAPVLLIDGSRHCNDLLLRNAVHEPVRAAMDAEVKQIAAWVADFYKGEQMGRRLARGGMGKARHDAWTS
ncbi:serine carboxypeptidase S28 [Apiospora kogelbergensis]|uniref:serine carboxypeptidase S28 n=1 Tax=Apiospora kogelbergensis TaxID=1337665 RepID=UPI00313151D0